MSKNLRSGIEIGSSYRQWYELLQDNHFMPINSFKRDLINKYRYMQFDNFGELYTYLAQNHREELIYHDVCQNSYLLNYEEGVFQWKPLADKDLLRF